MTNNQPYIETDQLVQLVDQKHKVLVQLRDLAQRQLAMVGADGDPTRLLGLLAMKQQLIDQLTAIETQLDPYRGQDPESRRWRTPADRRHCAETVQQCNAMLNDVMQMEQRSITDLTQRRDQTAQQLQAAAAASHARQAYATDAHTATGRLDLTSES